MAIVQELNEVYFVERFREMGRGDQFTSAALDALYDYLEELSADLGEDIKLDVIALCCDWYESTLDQLFSEYDIDVSDCEDEDALKQAALEYLEDNTTVIDCGDTFLYQAF